MSIINSQPLIGAAGQSAGGGFQIERSLRFNSADSAYLNRTPASAESVLTKFVFSTWVKKCRNVEDASTYYHPLITAGTGSGQYTLLGIDNGGSNTNTLNLFHDGFRKYYTNAVFRDNTAWYHIFVKCDSTASANQRCRFWVNGVEQTTVVNSEITSSDTFEIGNSVAHAIGKNVLGTNYFDGYLTETILVCGSSSPVVGDFGETDSATGVWKPKAFSGTYGTNGFYLKFADNSGTTSTTLGKDSSGNGNNWTPNNFSVTAGAGNDSLVDTPTAYGTDTGAGGEVRGNYCTLNPLFSGGTLANGNLDFSSSTAIRTATSTFAIPASGKWYWEVTVTAVGNSFQVGIAGQNASTTSYVGSSADAYAYSSSAVKYNNGSSSSYGASYTTNDVIGVAYDADAATLVFYKNNSSQGTAYSSLSGTFFPAVSYGSSSSSGSCVMNFGQRQFAYAAPSGFKALCTQNLPTPTIGATSSTQAGKYFNPVLYSSTGTNLSVTGVGFQPDLVWIKSRSSGLNHVLTDAVRGTTKELRTNSTNAESTVSTGVTSFDSDGFSIGTATDYNLNTATYVAWNWKANGAGSSNTAGSITSTVSANTTAGFSIVTYTGTGSNATVGHGLGVAPKMIIVKSRSGSATDWVVYHASLGATKNLRLQSTAVADTQTAMWNDTTPTSTVFTLGTNNNVNTNTQTQVAYCFAEVAGYSAFGSYTGNGSTDGPFVYTGFRPRYVMIKNITNTYSWWINDSARDPYNVAGKDLGADLSSAESADAPVQDFLSNGFKLRTSAYPGFNSNGDTYIYAAFAANPFKYSLGA